MATSVADAAALLASLDASLGAPAQSLAIYDGTNTFWLARPNVTDANLTGLIAITVTAYSGAGSIQGAYAFVPPTALLTADSSTTILAVDGQYILVG